MAICIDPKIDIDSIIDGIDAVSYTRPFASIDEVRNWEFNHSHISRLVTYKIGYNLGFKSNKTIESLELDIREKIPDLSSKLYDVYSYGLRNGRSVKELLLHPAILA